MRRCANHIWGCDTGPSGGHTVTAGSKHSDDDTDATSLARLLRRAKMRRHPILSESAGEAGNAKRAKSQEGLRALAVNAAREWATEGTLEVATGHSAAAGQSGGSRPTSDVAHCAPLHGSVLVGQLRLSGATLLSVRAIAHRQYCVRVLKLTVCCRSGTRITGRKPSIGAFPIAAAYAPLSGEWRHRQISIDLQWYIDLGVPMFLFLNLEGVNDEQSIPIHFRWRSTCNGVGRMSKK